VEELEEDVELEVVRMVVVVAGVVVVDEPKPPTLVVVASALPNSIREAMEPTLA